MTKETLAEVREKYEWYLVFYNRYQYVPQLAPTEPALTFEEYAALTPCENCGCRVGHIPGC